MTCTASRRTRPKLMRGAASVFAMLVGCSPLWATGDALACVQALTLPSAYSAFNRSIPATADVHIKVGKGGSAQSVTTDSNVRAIKLQLGAYFRERTRYSDACEGRTISFTIHYVLVGQPMDFGVSEVRLDPPDQIFVFCHRIKPTFDPMRPRDSKQAR